MIPNFADFCLWMRVLVDDAWQHLAPALRRPGPASRCSASELITMALVGECRGLDKETDLLSFWREPAQRSLFPQVPSRRRFNRRRRARAPAINLVRQVVLASLDLADDPQCVIDSLPLPLMQFHLVPGGSRAWATHGAPYGKCARKKQTIYGYKLHCVMTLGGKDQDTCQKETQELRIVGALEGCRKRENPFISCLFGRQRIRCSNSCQGVVGRNLLPGGGAAPPPGSNRARLVGAVLALGRRGAIPV